jgi:AcrR family transcriptional regulator
MTTLRRDAARNRDRIITAARELNTRGEALQFNTVARWAEVGVGTVYRHFATPEALTEALVDDRFTELVDLASAAANGADPVGSLRRFLAESLQVFAEDASFAAASVNPRPARSETAALRTKLLDAFRALVASSAGALRPELDGDEMFILMCGLGYSARLRPDKAPAYLDALMDGVFR